MKEFEEWWKTKKYPGLGGIALNSDDHFNHKSPSDIADATWRAALEWFRDTMDDFPTITVDVALCWKDIIRKELEGK